jgi:hypothetical protein
MIIPVETMKPPRTIAVIVPALKFYDPSSSGKLSELSDLKP